MYHIKPIISSDIQIDYPTSMYRIKPISTDHLSQSTNLNVVDIKLADSKGRDSDMDKLEARQEIILKHLKELKDRLMSMHKELKICSKPAQQSKVHQSEQPRIAQRPIDASNLRDIVINANPKNVPFSLVILKKLWTDRLSIKLQFYTHSTVSSLSQSASNFQNICTAHQSTSATNLNISLIWKNIDNIEMINGSVPVIGESNILRYLARIGPNEFNYESNGLNANEMDSQLDLSELLVAAPTPKDRQVILKNLNSILGKNEYFGGSEPRINDVCLASAVLQSTADKELPPSLLKWSRKVMG